MSKSLENGPKFGIVGDASIERKEKAMNDLEKGFSDNRSVLKGEVWKEALGKEIEKTEKGTQIIGAMNQATNQLMERLGVSSYDMPIDNFHVVPHDVFEKLHPDGIVAFSIPEKQAIIIDNDSKKEDAIKFAIALYHELLHSKGKIVNEVEKIGDRTVSTSYRKGLDVGASQQAMIQGMDHVHFRGLHEAVIATQQKKFFPEMMELPMFKEEWEFLNSEDIKDSKKKIAGIKRIAEDDIEWIDSRGGVLDVKYRPQRQALEGLMMVVQKEFPDEYKTTDDVFDEFLRAHFTGHLMKIAHLVEKSFGEGSFRVLSSMTAKDDSVPHVFEMLQKSRGRMLKQREEQSPPAGGSASELKKDNEK